MKETIKDIFTEEELTVISRFANEPIDKFLNYSAELSVDKERMGDETNE